MSVSKQSDREAGCERNAHAIPRAAVQGFDFLSVRLR